MDPRLKGVDPKMVEMISNDILDRSPGVGWDDIGNAFPISSFRIPSPSQPDWSSPKRVCKKLLSGRC